MSERSDELLRGFQAQEKRFVERRFPLRFAPESPALRELYAQAKGLRWNPETDIAWGRLDPDAYARPVREAARLVWSRRAWGAYPGLAENTALLIRFCLESGAAGMDAKLFLSFRPAEEAKHLEACFLFARRLGGYESTPAAAVARASNQPFAQMALDPDVSVEALVAALGCLDDQLDLNLCLCHLQHSRDETARQILRLVTGDKQRHVLFAWTLLGDRLPRLDAAGRAGPHRGARPGRLHRRPREGGGARHPRPGAGAARHVGDRATSRRSSGARPRMRGRSIARYRRTPS